MTFSVASLFDFRSATHDTIDALAKPNTTHDITSNPTKPVKYDATSQHDTMVLFLGINGTSDGLVPLSGCYEHVGTLVAVGWINSGRHSQGFVAIRTLVTAGPERAAAAAE